MSNTTRARYRFTVKAFHDGTPWIALEPLESHLPCLSSGFLGFDLKPGTSTTDAERLAEMMNEQITTTSYTS